MRQITLLSYAVGLCYAPLRVSEQTRRDEEGERKGRKNGEERGEEKNLKEKDK